MSHTFEGLTKIGMKRNHNSSIFFSLLYCLKKIEKRFDNPDDLC